MMFSNGNNLQCSYTYNGEFKCEAEKVIFVVKVTYRHPSILNTMMMLQNIEQMKVKRNRRFLNY